MVYVGALISWFDNDTISVRHEELRLLSSPYGLVVSCVNTQEYYLGLVFLEVDLKPKDLEVPPMI